MSKVGEKPVEIKTGVTLSKEGKTVLVKGPLGELKVNIPDGIEVEIAEKEVKIKRLGEDKKIKALHGTTARLLKNAIEGVSSGFSKTLEIVGTGYRGQMEGSELVLFLGFSHPVRFSPPPGIKLEVQEGNKIKVFGISKEEVGRIADKIKKIKKPDSYKGKGIRYLGEKLRLKPGKAVAKTGGGK